MKRPLPVLVFGCLFIFAGAVGIGYHLRMRPLEQDFLLLEAVRLIAIIGGVFLLLGRNWARWLLAAWLAFHVGVSFFHSIEEVAAHAVFLLLYGFFLFRAPASGYFCVPR
jgi:hypothetical protein